ncbi:MAG TPA: 16S rRNA (guanine(966)-N(2))-methyltransferase RsmD [Candidatus Saccharibacteria bacterium]|nr:16S rRNA (guanine(966)-N(2))-methyltransferase RsmD [Candidatus Saccharibacteria bacterium]
MRVRLISGQYGGRILDAPDTSKTHPMSERIRNAIFNSLGDRVADAVVLDAFAGSGAVGFEALSRGASRVIFLEKDRIASKVIAKNIETLDCGDEAQLIKASVAAWSENNPATQFDLIFADPPYHDPQFSTVTRLFSHLKPGALMVLSHSGRGEAPTGTKGIVVVDNRSYGTASLTFFRRES